MHFVNSKYSYLKLYDVQQLNIRQKWIYWRNKLKSSKNFLMIVQSKPLNLRWSSILIRTSIPMNGWIQLLMKPIILWKEHSFWEDWSTSKIPILQMDLNCLCNQWLVELSKQPISSNLIPLILANSQQTLLWMLMIENRMWKRDKTSSKNWDQVKMMCKRNFSIWVMQ